MEEENLLASVELKIDNLDARNMRQLNQLYAEIKKLQGTYYMPPARKMLSLNLSSRNG